MLTACPSCTRTGEARELVGAPHVAAQPWTAWRALLVLGVGTGVGFLTGLFGVGGGFVVVPALTLVMGFAMPEAIGTSLLVVAINSAIALLARAGAARVDWMLAGAFTVAAVAGVTLGARLADRLEPERSLRAFAAGLVLLAVYSAWRAVAALI